MHVVRLCESCLSKAVPFSYQRKNLWCHYSGVCLSATQQPKISPNRHRKETVLWHRVFYSSVLPLHKYQFLIFALLMVSHFTNATKCISLAFTSFSVTPGFSVTCTHMHTRTHHSLSLSGSSIVKSLSLPSITHTGKKQFHSSEALYCPEPECAQKHFVLIRLSAIKTVVGHILSEVCNIISLTALTDSGTQKYTPHGETLETAMERNYS